MDIRKIQRGMRKQFYFTYHAIEKMLEREIDEVEIEEAVAGGEILEEYSEDKYGPTCLILGMTAKGRPLHVLISYSEPIWVITAYEPEDTDWISFKVRRTK